MEDAIETDDLIKWQTMFRQLGNLARKHGYGDGRVAAEALERTCKAELDARAAELNPG